MEKKRIYLMCGVAGSGKSTWIKNQIQQHGGIHISRDAVRFSLVKENEEYFSKEKEVFEQWIFCIQQALSDTFGPKDIYVDATHLTPSSRAKTLSKLDLKNVELIAVVMDTSFEETLLRNSFRTGRERVPDSVIADMRKRFILPCYQEGFDNIIQVRG